MVESVKARENWFRQRCFFRRFGRSCLDGVFQLRDADLFPSGYSAQHCTGRIPSLPPSRFKCTCPLTRSLRRVRAVRPSVRSFVRPSSWVLSLSRSFSLSFSFSLFHSSFARSSARSLVNRNPRCFSSRVFVARKKPHRAPRQKAGWDTAVCLRFANLNRRWQHIYDRQAGKALRPVLRFYILQFIPNIS